MRHLTSHLSNGARTVTSPSQTVMVGRLNPQNKPRIIPTVIEHRLSVLLSFTTTTPPAAAVVVSVSVHG